MNVQQCLGSSQASNHRQLFLKSRLVHKGEVIAEGTEETVINGIALEEIGEQIKVESNCEEFINIDEDVAMCNTDISAEVVDKYVSSEEEIVKEQEPVKPILTISQATTCVEDLRRFVEADENVSGTVIKCFGRVQ